MADRRSERRPFEFAHDLFDIELGVRSIVPFDQEGRQPFLCSAHMVGDDGDGVVQPHDLTHTFNGLGRRIIHALNAAAEDRRLRECRDLYARRPNIDAINGRSVEYLSLRSVGA
jgi:hypothetical protein